MSIPTVLPDSRATNPKRGQYRDGQWWVPVYCANCGAELGIVPEPSTTFAFFLCDARCAETWAPKAGEMVEPDVVFFQTLLDEQLDRYGRELTATELMAALADETHPIHQLVRERHDELRRLNPALVVPAL